MLDRMSEMFDMFKDIELNIGNIIGLAITVAFFGYMAYVGIEGLCESHRINKSIKKMNLVFKSYYEKMIPLQCSKCKWAKKEYRPGGYWVGSGGYKPVYCKKFRKPISISAVIPRCDARLLVDREWELLVRKSTNHHQINKN